MEQSDAQFSDNKIQGMGVEQLLEAAQFLDSVRQKPRDRAKDSVGRRESDISRFEAEKSERMLVEGKLFGFRIVHNELEKKRRAHMNKCFDYLRSRIPAIASDMKKISNLTILKHALRIIKISRKVERQYEWDLQCVVKQQMELNSKISYVSNTLSDMNVDVGVLLPDVDDNSSSTTTATETGSLPGEISECCATTAAGISVPTKRPAPELLTDSLDAKRIQLDSRPSLKAPSCSSKTDSVAAASLSLSSVSKVKNGISMEGNFISTTKNKKGAQLSNLLSSTNLQLEGYSTTPSTSVCAGVTSTPLAATTKVSKSETSAKLQSIQVPIVHLQSAPQGSTVLAQLPLKPLSPLLKPQTKEVPPVVIGPILVKQNNVTKQPVSLAQLLRTTTPVATPCLEEDIRASNSKSPQCLLSTDKQLQSKTPQLVMTSMPLQKKNELLLPTQQLLPMSPRLTSPITFVPASPPLQPIKTLSLVPQPINTLQAVVQQPINTLSVMQPASQTLLTGSNGTPLLMPVQLNPLVVVSTPAPIVLAPISAQVSKLTAITKATPSK